VSKQWKGLHAVWAIWDEDSATLDNEVLRLQRDIGAWRPVAAVASAFLVMTHPTPFTPVTMSTCHTDGPPPTVYTLFDRFDDHGDVFYPFACPRQHCQWRDGLHAALRVARRLKLPCDYFFTVEDDVEWSIPPKFAATSQSPKTSQRKALTADGLSSALTEELRSVLHSWKPAVAAFGAPVEEATMPNLKTIADAFADDKVAPMTCFDAGSIVFHASIADFLMPYAPTGDGGFNGNWTMPGLWLNMFLPSMFRPRSIRINSIGFVDTWYTGDARSLRAEGVQQPNTAFQARMIARRGRFLANRGSPSNEDVILPKYELYVKETFKVEAYGPSMELSDVDWRPQRGQPPHNIALYPRVKDVVDFKHPAFAKNLLRIADALIPRFRVILLAYRDVVELEQCLKALEKALYNSAYQIDVVVHGLYSNEDDNELAEAIATDSFKWQWGSVSFVSHGPNTDVSPNEFAQHLWDPDNFTEFAVILNDNVKVGNSLMISFTLQVLC
jgi:hypothetical protein